MLSRYEELEGSVEEVCEQLGAYMGKRVRVTVLAVTERVDQDESHCDLAEDLFARFAQAPASERAKVPIDLADNLDHYIYRQPSR